MLIPPPQGQGGDAPEAAGAEWGITFSDSSSSTQLRVGTQPGPKGLSRAAKGVGQIKGLLAEVTGERTLPGKAHDPPNIASQSIRLKRFTTAETDKRRTLGADA